MSIIDLLSESASRIQFENKWLIVNREYDMDNGKTIRFTVYEQGYRKHKPTVIYDGYSESSAVDAMMKGEE